MHTTAVVFPNPNQIVLDEVELPDLRPQDVLIRTEFSFISTGTERWTLQGEMGLRWRGGFRFPLVPGYQKVGRVEQVGSQVTRVRPGQRVFMTTGRLQNITAAWGGHLQHAVEQDAEVYPLPDDLPGEDAAGLVVVQVGWNTGQRPALSGGELAVVIGDGIIGQFTAQALRARGAQVWLSGRHPLRLELAQRWTADRALDARTEDLSAAVHAERPDGADIVVETVCHPADTPSYIELLRPRGQLVIAAYHPHDNLVDLSPVQDKEITIHSTGGWTRLGLESTIADIRADRFHVGPLITHRVPWRDAPRAYERLVRDKIEDSLGIVIDWR
ncbi:zinc-binding dehydrogenase [bacterium]|nr:zinc-binding dehydrogenase [bacterium]